MLSKIRLHVGQLAILVVLLSAWSGGCANDFTRFIFGSVPIPPKVPELDKYVINLDVIHRTSSRDDVRAVLGEPPFVYETYGDGELQYTTWRYPIRDIAAVPLPYGATAQRKVISAAELRIWLDSSGRVDTWGFFHPITNAPLDVHESIDQADFRLGKMCKPPKRIDLAAVLRQGTPKEKVLVAMHWFEGAITTEQERSQVRISREGQQTILIYYADRPSPRYVPPYYVVVTFSARGDLGTSWYFEGWGGCK